MARTIAIHGFTLYKSNPYKSRPEHFIVQSSMQYSVKGCVCVCVIVSVLGRREVIQILKDVITDSLKDQGKEDSVHRMGLQFLFMVHQFLLAGVEPWVIMNNMLMHQAHSQTLVSPCLVKQGLALALYIFVTGL